MVAWPGQLISQSSIVGGQSSSTAWREKRDKKRWKSPRWRANTHTHTHTHTHSKRLLKRMPDQCRQAHACLRLRQALKKRCITMQWHAQKCGLHGQHQAERKQLWGGVIISTSTVKQNGACAHYVMLSKIQWEPFWLAIRLSPENDWTSQV